MTQAEKVLRERIRRRVAGMAPGIVERELAAFALIRGSLTERELVAALDNGTIDALLERLLSDDALTGPFARLRAHIDAASLRAAETAVGDLPRQWRAVFNVLNPIVIQAVRNLNDEALRRLTGDVRETVRQRMLAGIQAGENPRQTARGMRDVIGLAPRQEAAVRNFMDELRRGDRKALRRALAKGHFRTETGEVLKRRAHAGGQGLSSRQLGTLMRDLGTRQLTEAEINTMAREYRKRLMAWNAEANARTIALNANKAAQRLAWENSIDVGAVDRARLQRTWIAVGGPAGDGRNRPEHLDLHGTTVGFDERYPNGQLTPGETDFNCRCIERVTVKRRAQEVAAA